jgi:hypothetical protein
MPPRFAYWTIIFGGQPTSFRSASRDELLPTFKQIQAKHPDAQLRYFARGKLWYSDEEAQAALLRERSQRSDGRRHGPRDEPRRDNREGWKPPSGDRGPRGFDRKPGERKAWAPRPEGGDRKPWRPKPDGGDRKPWRPKPEGGDRKPWRSKSEEGGRKPWRPKPQDGERRPWTPKPQGERKAWAPRPEGDERKTWRPKSQEGGRKPWRPKPEGGDGKPWRPKSEGGDRKPWTPKPEGARGRDWRPGGTHQDPRARFKVPRDVKRARMAKKFGWKKKREDE